MDKLLTICSNVIDEINLIILEVEKLPSKIKDNEIIASIAEEYKYILIDGFTFLNETQFEIDSYTGKKSTLFDTYDIVNKCVSQLRRI